MRTHGLLVRSKRTQIQSHFFPNVFFLSLDITRNGNKRRTCRSKIVYCQRTEIEILTREDHWAALKCSRNRIIDHLVRNYLVREALSSFGTNFFFWWLQFQSKNDPTTTRSFKIAVNWISNERFLRSKPSVPLLIRDNFQFRVAKKYR